MECGAKNQSSGNIVFSMIGESNRNTLIIYIHRHESERLVSGVKKVLISRICSLKSSNKIILHCRSVNILSCLKVIDISF